jgi:phosphatidylglycerophosphate synthase
VAEPRVGGPSLKTREGTGARLGWDEYSARWSGLHLGVDPRRSRALVRGWLRAGYLTGRSLAALRVRPGAVTLAGVVLALATPFAAAEGRGWLFVAAAAVLASALADTADGALAVITSRTTRLGGFYDSMADRVSEALWLLALWVAGVPGVLATACGVMAWLHEYARARSAAVGIGDIGVVTAAERPGRVIVVIFAFVVGGGISFLSARFAAGSMTVVLAIWPVLGLLGTARLLGAVRATARGRPN